MGEIMNEFKILITEKNLSNAQVAKIVKKHVRSVQRWSAGTASPSYAELQIIKDHKGEL